MGFTLDTERLYIGNPLGSGNILMSIGSGGFDLGNGADGYVSFFTGPNAIAGDNDFFWDRENNRLGLRTDTPTHTLTVDGYITPATDNFHALGTPDQRWEALWLGPSSLHLTSTAAETGTAFDWRIGIDQTTGNEGSLVFVQGEQVFLSIDPVTGNIRFETGDELQVSGAIKIPELSSPPLDEAGFGKLYVDAGDSALHFLDDGGTDYNLLTTGGTGNVDSSQGSDGYVAFFTGPGVLAGDNDLFFDRENHNFTLTGGGKVGIGTTSPSTTLDVDHNTSANASLRVRGIVGSMSVKSTGTGSSDRTTLTVFNDNDAQFLQIDSFPNADGGSVMGIARARTVGIEAFGSNALFIRSNSGGGPIHMGTENTHALTIDTSQQVGIGTSSPQNILDIAGGIVIGSTSAGTNSAPTDGLRVDGHVGIGIDPGATNLYIYEDQDALTDFNIRNDNDTANAGATISVTAGGTYSQINSYRTQTTGTRFGMGLNYATEFIARGNTQKFLIGTEIGAPIIFGTNNSVSGIIDSSGRYGIGTTGAHEALTINGIISLQEQDDYNRTHDGYGSIWVKSDGTVHFTNDSGTDYDLTATGGTGDVSQTSGFTGADGYVAFFTGNGEVAGDNDFYWDRANNRLGIGTTSPSNQLHVRTDIDDHTTLKVENATNADGAEARVEIINNNGGARLALYSQSSTQSYGTISLADTFRITSGNVISGGVLLGSDGSAPVRIGTDSVERIYIESTGEIGIGTDTPKNALDVSGASVIGSSYAGTNTAPTNGLLVEGNTGIGTSDPQTVLHLVGGGGELGTLPILGANDTFVIEGNSHIGMDIIGSNEKTSYINFGDDDDRNIGRISYDHRGDLLNFKVAGSDNALVINSLHNIGIGTATPIEPLTVIGTIAISEQLQPATQDGYGKIWVDTSGELNFVDDDGNNVLITSSGSVNAAAGGGDVSQTSGFTGADGYVTFWTGDGEIAGDNDLFWDRVNNRLGIGTNNPGVKLRVREDYDGDAEINAFNGLNGANATAIISASASGNNIKVISYADNHSTRADENWIVSTATGSGIVIGTQDTEAIRIDSSQQVGIGATPATKLYIEDDADALVASRLVNINTGTSAIASIQAQNDSGATGLIQVTSSNYSNTFDGIAREDAVALIASSDASKLFLYSSSGPIHMLSNSVHAITIDTSQQTGIGTQTPNRVLEVRNDTSNEGRLRITSTATTGSAYSGLEFFGKDGTASTFGGGLFREQDTDDITIWTSGGAVITAQDSSGFVGIGTTANEKLTVDGVLSLDEVSAPTLTTGYGKVFVGTDSELHFLDDSGNNVQITSGGAVNAAGSGVQKASGFDGADGYLAFWTGSNDIAGDNDLFFDRVTHNLTLRGGGRLGIGTPSAPGVPLDVNIDALDGTGIRLLSLGSSVAQWEAQNSPLSTVFSTANNRDLFLEPSSGSVIINRASGDPKLSFAIADTTKFTMGSDDTDSDRFKIGTTDITTSTFITLDQSNGNVGIGVVTTIDEKLHIQGTDPYIRIHTGGTFWNVGSDTSDGIFRLKWGAANRITISPSSSESSVRLETHLGLANNTNPPPRLEGYGKVYTTNGNLYFKNDRDEEYLLNVGPILDGYSGGGGGGDVSQTSGFTGADGYVAFFTGAGEIAGDNDLFYSRETSSLILGGGGKLGIGNSNPDRNLHITDANSSAHIEIEGTNAVSLRWQTTGGTGNKLWNMAVHDNDSRIAIQEDGTTASTRFLIHEGGKVGLGSQLSTSVVDNVNDLNVRGNASIGGGASFHTASAPTDGLAVEGQVTIGRTSISTGAKLEVYGSTNDGSEDLWVNNFAPGIRLIDRSSSADDFRIGIDDGTLKISIDTDDDNAQDADGHFDDTPNALTIDGSTGNIGIGVASAANKLDVVGAAVIGASYSGSQTAPSNGLLVQGNVSIGTSSNANTLDVEGTLAVGSSYSGTTAAPTSGMIVEGVVGIGTNSPSTSNQLHVVGNSGRVVIQDNETNNNKKVARIGGGHFSNSENPVNGMMIIGNEGDNRINIGGGTGLYNATNRIVFYTAETSTSGLGSARMMLNSEGHLGLGGTFNPHESLTVNGIISLEEQDNYDRTHDGYGSLWAKSDGKLYFTNDAGTEYDLTSGSGGGAPQYSVSSSQTSGFTASFDTVYRCDPSGGGFTVTLPAASGGTGQTIIIKNTTNSTNTITIQGTGGEQIDGQASVTIESGYEAITFVSYGSEWGRI